MARRCRCPPGHPWACRLPLSALQVSTPLGLCSSCPAPVLLARRLPLNCWSPTRPCTAAAWPRRLAWTRCQALLNTRWAGPRRPLLIQASRSGLGPVWRCGVCMVVNCVNVTPAMVAGCRTTSGRPSCRATSMPMVGCQCMARLRCAASARLRPDLVAAGCRQPHAAAAASSAAGQAKPFASRPLQAHPAPLPPLPADEWGIVSTPRGLRMYGWSRWGNLRYASSAAFVSLLYAKQLPAGPVSVSAAERGGQRHGRDAPRRADTSVEWLPSMLFPSRCSLPFAFICRSASTPPGLPSPRLTTPWGPPARAMCLDGARAGPGRRTTPAHPAPTGPPPATRPTLTARWPTPRWDGGKGAELTCGRRGNLPRFGAAATAQPLMLVDLSFCIGICWLPPGFPCCRRRHPLPPSRRAQAAHCTCPPQVLRGALIAGPTGCQIADQEKCGDVEGQPKVRHMRWSTNLHAACRAPNVPTLCCAC